MNDWNDKFHFYVSVEKPSEVKQSFDLFFLNSLKTKKNQSKWKIKKNVSKLCPARNFWRLKKL